jgi:hypothetical protein
VSIWRGFPSSERSLHTRVLLELGDPPNTEEGTLLDELQYFALTRDEGEVDFGYSPIKRLLKDASYPPQSTPQQKRTILRKSKSFTLINDVLYRAGRDGVLRRVVNRDEASNIIPQCHEGICGGHFAEDITAKKILMAGYFWLTMFKDCNEYCCSCPACQAYGKRSFIHTEYHPIISMGAFKKWGLDFVGPLTKNNKGNVYLLVATDHLTKWAEAAAVKRNTTVVVVDFLDNQISCITRLFANMDAPLSL